MDTHYKNLIYLKHKKINNYGNFDSNIEKKSYQMAYELIQPRISKKISYDCKCENCIQAKTLVNLPKGNRIQFNKMRIQQQVNKNKLYLCETRTKALIDELIKFTENNDKNIVLLVPNEESTINKIKNKLIELSDGKIKKKFFNKLELNSHLIHLISPYYRYSILEGFEENPENICVVLNGFYYHMYLSNLWIEEILYVLSKFNSSKILVLDDNFQTFIKENIFIKKIFDKLKIC